MRDGFEDAIPEHPRPRLTYPFEAGPKTGEALDVAPGVKWLRMPLGGSLAYINVWAIAEDGGWAIVDTGMGGPETQQAWRKAFAGSFMSRAVLVADIGTSSRSRTRVRMSTAVGGSNASRVIRAWGSPSLAVAR